MVMSCGVDLLLALVHDIGGGVARFSIFAHDSNPFDMLQHKPHVIAKVPPHIPPTERWQACH